MEWFPLELPSKCQVYSDVLPETVQIRTLQGKDEKLIAEMSLDNFDAKFSVLLKNIVKGIPDTKNLTMGDRLHIVLWEAINSYSKDYPIKVTCSECLNEIDVTVDLSSINVTQLPDGFVEPVSRKLSTGNVKLKLLRVADEIRIQEYEKAGKDSWLYRWALSMVDDKQVWDRLPVLESMGVKDIAVIRAFQEEFKHGPDMKCNYTCPKCGGVGETLIPFRIGLIFPYGNSLTRYFRG